VCVCVCVCVQSFFMDAGVHKESSACQLCCVFELGSLKKMFSFYFVWRLKMIKVGGGVD